MLTDYSDNAGINTRQSNCGIPLQSLSANFDNGAFTDESINKGTAFLSDPANGVLPLAGVLDGATIISNTHKVFYLAFFNCHVLIYMCIRIYTIIYLEYD